MSDNKRLANTLLVSGLAAILSYLINYFLTSYIAEHVGIEAYGFVSMAKTSVNYAHIITIALTNFTVRYITVSYHEKKYQEAKSYFSSSIIAHIVLSLAILIVALVAIFKLEYLLEIPTSLISSVKLLFAVIFINFTIATIQIPFNTAAVIKNRLDIVGIFKIISYLCDAGILLLLFYLFSPSVWFVGIGTLTATLVTFSCNAILTKKLTPELKYDKNLSSFQKIKDIIRHGIFNSINSLGNVLNSGLDLIVSNKLLTAVETGQIAVVKTIEGIFSLLSATLFQALQPRLIKAYTSSNMQSFMKQLQKSMKICGYFSNLLFAGFVALGGLYFQLWLPKEDHALLHQLTVITTMMYVMDGIMKPVYYANVLTLKNAVPCFVTIVSGLFNVFAKFVLLSLTTLRSFAVIGTTSVIMLTLNFTFHPLYAARILKTSPKPIYQVMFRQIISAAAMVATFVFINSLIDPHGWLGLIASALLMSVVGLVIHVLCVCNREEITALIRKAKR